jgi:hypothetical protein
MVYSGVGSGGWRLVWIDGWVGVVCVGWCWLGLGQEARVGMVVAQRRVGALGWWPGLVVMLRWGGGVCAVRCIWGGAAGLRIPVG